MKKFASGKFLKVNIEISNICNLQCSFCPEVIRAKELMSVALFERVISQVAPITDQVCFHLMGEPLVHPKLKEFVEICEKYQVKIYLVTNGVLLRPDRTELLLHPAFRQVNFSLHSFPDNFGDKDPTPYLEKVFAFTESALSIRPDLYINYRLWNLQTPSGQESKNQEILSQIERRFGAFDPSVDVRVKKSVRIKNRLSMHFDTEFTWPSLDLPVIGEEGTCQGLRNHFGILVDGTVVPCCLDKEGKIPLGNIAREELSVILESEKALSMIKGFRERKLTDPLCQRCDYVTRF